MSSTSSRPARDANAGIVPLSDPVAYETNLRFVRYFLLKKKKPRILNEEKNTGGTRVACAIIVKKI